jgi:Flp pilus assembly protein TadG
METAVKQIFTRRLHSQDSGAQIAEFAAVVPMLVMMIFGILWFGRAFNIYTTVNRAARAAAEAAALHKCATCGNTGADKDTIETSVVDPILAAAHLDPSKKTGWDIDAVQVDTAANPVNVFRAHFNYRYDFKLNWLTCCPPALEPLSLGVTMKAQAQSKEEQ